MKMISGRKTLQEIATDRGVHPLQVGQLLEADSETL